MVFSVFSRLEKSKVGVAPLFFVLLSAVLARIVLEWVLEAGHQLQSPASLFLFLSYFSVTLCGVVLLLWLFSGKPLVGVVRVVAGFSWLLWVPPVFDFLWSGGKGYALSFVFSVAGFWEAFSSFCASCVGVSPGLQAEVFLLLFVAFAYVFWASKSLFRGVLAVLGVYAWVLFGALFPGFLMGFFGHAFQDAFLFRETLSAYAVALSAFFFAFLASDKKVAAAFWSRLRLERSLHYAGVALFGAVLGFSFWEHSFPGVLLPLAALLFSVFFAFEAAVWVNDAFDERIDRISSPKRVKLASLLEPYQGFFLAAFLVLSLVAGLAAGFGVWLWVGFALALSAAYSVPPLRLRWHFLSSSLVIALCSTVVFVAGFSLGLLEPETVLAVVPVEWVAMVFGFVFLASPLVCLKDADGDKKAGVLTLASWLGLRRAWWAVLGLTVSAVAWAAYFAALSWVWAALFAVAVAVCFVWTRFAAVKLEPLAFLLEYAFLVVVALHLV
ncbi:UbiA family prenyltransferase [Candidatus Micrarchaeota archaeon]|nr:UbiA family prenyltransferase [Candidatus Micrarchaeota archaeon]